MTNVTAKGFATILAKARNQGVVSKEKLGAVIAALEEVQEELEDRVTQDRVHGFSATISMKRVEVINDFIENVGNMSDFS